MRRTCFPQARCRSAPDLSNFSILLAYLLLISVLGICKLLPMTRLKGPFVALPTLENQSTTQTARKRAIVISLTREKQIYLNDRIVPSEELLPRILLLRKISGNAPLYLKLDKRVSFGMAINIWHAITTQQRETVSLVVSGRDSFDQRILQVEISWAALPSNYSTWPDSQNCPIDDHTRHAAPSGAHRLFSYGDQGGEPPDHPDTVWAYHGETGSYDRTVFRS